MPEGHVIHRLAREISRIFGGQTVSVSSPHRRFATEATRLDGAVLVGSEAIGKHLFIEFDVPEPRFVHIHLGLIGKLVIHEMGSARGQVRLRIHDATTAADLHGPQWCRAITTAQRDAVWGASGPDPLRADADPARGYERVRRSGKSIAALLMDQRVAAGVGNIFRAEVLFRHRLRPTTPGTQVDARTWQIIWDDLVDLMARALQVGRIDTVDHEHSPEAQSRPPREDRHGGRGRTGSRSRRTCGPRPGRPGPRSPTRRRCAGRCWASRHRRA